MRSPGPRPPLAPRRGPLKSQLPATPNAGQHVVGPPPPLMAEPPPPAEQVELMGLSVMVTVMERMDPAERRRALAYLTDRYGEDTRG